MSRRPFAARFVTIATLAALATGMLGTTIAQARSPQAPDRQLRIADDPARESAGVRSFRHVDVATLPAPSGRRTPFEPDLGRPDGFGEAAPPDVAGVLEPVLATTNADPAIEEATSYAGLARVAGTPQVPSSTDGEPPDPWVATGPEHVFQAVNTEFRVTDRAGNELAAADMFDFFGLGQFYDPGEVAYFDPRVIYDSLHQRWVAVEASFDCFVQAPSTVGTGYIDIAISDGPDPTAGWGVLSIAYSDALPDYPGIGTSTDKVVTSANVFALDIGGDMGCEPVGEAGFLGTEMDVVAWSELIGSGPVNIDFLYSTNNFPNNFFSWRPALQTPATSSTVFAIAERIDEDVAYARINGSPAAGGVTTIAVSNLAGVIGPFAEAPPPMQPGSPATIVRAFDARPTDAVWMGNRLAFVSTYPCVADGGTLGVDRDCVRVSELLTTVPNTPTLIQDFLIAEPDADLYMGGVGYALNGTLHAVWTRSSEDAGQYASSHAAYQTPNVIDNSISDVALLSAGSGTYDGERWGDYVGVAQDPQVPNAVWQGNQYSIGGTWGWATEVSQLQTGGTSYVPIEPVRVLDTRPGFSIGLVGAFAANVPRSFAVAGAFTIPADAVAVTGNVTVANQTAGGYLSVTPSPVANPLSSTVNFPLGDTRANNLTVPLASDGKLAAVYKAPAGKTTHLIVDITGYFLAGDEDATYATLAPVRVLDTRPVFDIGLTGAFVANVPRQLNITGLPDIPDDATAITGNLTVVGQARAGYLAITKTSQANPTTSTLNFPLGDVRANGVSVPLNPGGGLWIVYKASGGSTHVILDVTGYYRDAPSGLLFYPLTPGRVMDTRPNVLLSGLSGAFAASTPRRLDVAGHWGAPVGANAITGNLTIVNQTAAGYVSATLNSDANPTTSVLNFPLGDTRANGVTLPLNGAGREWFVYKAPGGKSAHLILDLSGYFD